MKTKTMIAAIVLLFAGAIVVKTLPQSEAAYTSPIVDNEGNTVSGSIAALEQVRLNGIEQWILIRGRDTSKPVLLFLHGGPGFSLMPFVSLFQTAELEANFVVVHWDQRGTGKSYSEDLSPEDMRVAKLVEDTRDLTRHLCARFGKDRIFMLGHSWGSALGFMTISEYPELYHAYVAAGEAADWNKRQKMSFNWTLDQARRENHQQAMKALESLQPFSSDSQPHIAIKNEWLAVFGGEYHARAMYETYENHIGQGTEYTDDDLRKLEAGSQWSEETLEAEAIRSGYSLFQSLPETSTPVYFFAGRHDHQTPSSLAKDYYDVLVAPTKEFIWFEESAHYTIFAESDKATRELIRIAKQTLSGN
jgi:pimeloyl-ACP methyl ester carboxylesterase